MENIEVNEYIPKRQTMFSAGYDLYANEEMVITNTHYKVYDTGVRLNNDIILNTLYHIPKAKNAKIKQQITAFQHYVAIVVPRSSYGFKYGLRFANTMGVIDQDYPDTIKLSMKCDTPLTIKKGDRYAQIIFVPIGLVLNEVRPTDFRKGGMGSTDDKSKSQTTLDEVKE